MLTQPLLLQGPPGRPIHLVSQRAFSFVSLGKAWGRVGWQLTPVLATVATTRSWTWGCPGPYVAPYWTLGPEAPEAGNPDFSWDVALTVTPIRHSSRGSWALVVPLVQIG